MAKYLVLIYGSEQEWDAQTPDQLQAKEAGHIAFSRAAGTGRLSGQELESSTTATTLRASGNGTPIVTDGPFMETKEALGGFYVLDVPDLDAAVTLARMLPELREQHGAVEVRPIVDHG
ncbi:YciI family protein [Terrabacter terrigena]|uniref:YciI family protein n=1 Tax=Terrabacter terrigena TaxID=574718 RepID=A0ABW3MU58_9MICO